MPQSPQPRNRVPCCQAKAVSGQVCWHGEETRRSGDRRFNSIRMPVPWVGAVGRFAVVACAAIGIASDDCVTAEAVVAHKNLESTLHVPAAGLADRTAPSRSIGPVSGSMRDLPTGTGRTPDGLRCLPILRWPPRIWVKFAIASCLEGQRPVWKFMRVGSQQALDDRTQLRAQGGVLLT